MFIRHLFSTGNEKKSERQMPFTNSTKLTFMVKREVKQLLEEGRAHFNEGRIQEAIRHYNKAVEADPSCSLCHFNLGYAHHEDGQYEMARARYEKAIELEPSCGLFLEHLARLFFENSDYAEASRFFQRASLIGPIQPLSLGLWGRSLFERGLYEKSIQTFERLLEKDHQPAIQVGAHYWLSIANTKLGRIATARELAEKILSFKDIDYKILYDLGENFIHARCLSLAKRIFERLAIEREELLLARLRLEDIRSLEKQINEILPKLFDGDEERMLHQIHALREFGANRVSRALLSFINHPSAPIRENVIKYQSQYGYDVSESILPLLSDNVDYVRDAAYEYFEKSNCGHQIEEIIKGLEDPQPEIRKKAANIIGRFGTIKTLPDLQMSISDPTNEKIIDTLNKAVSSIKYRYQKQQDSLYSMNAPTPLQEKKKISPNESRFWMNILLIFFQISALLYFLYVILMK